MNAFSLIQKFHAQRADLNVIMDEWLEVSKAKGWPATEEGLRRYLVRLEELGDDGKIPRRSSKAPYQKTTLPPGFPEWWNKHPHSSTISVHLAYQCASYFDQWKGNPAYDPKSFPDSAQPARVRYTHDDKPEEEWRTELEYQRQDILNKLKP